MRMRPWLWSGLAAAVLIGGCATRQPADELGSAEATAKPAIIPGSTMPLDLREFEVVSSEGGYRGVFLKLTRLPTTVTHSSATEPARIVLDIQGPTGIDTAEEVFPAGDTLVTRMRVTRQIGGLHVELDLVGNAVPEYGVFPMADWIMVRIKPERRERPWTQRAS